MWEGPILNTFHPSLAEMLVLVATAGAGRMAPPTSTRIPAMLKRVQSHVSLVNGVTDHAILSSGVLARDGDLAIAGVVGRRARPPHPQRVLAVRRGAHMHLRAASPMSCWCVPGYFEVINTRTVGFLTIPRASIKWV